jgi:TRAP-type C4-dicarboxylate transport system permease small subunit
MATSWPISLEELRKQALGALAKCAIFLTQNWIAIVGALLVAALLIVGSVWNWDYWSELTYDQSHNLKEIKLDRPRIIQQLLLVVGGTAAFFLAAWRTWTAHRQAKAALRQVEVALRQADLAERAHNVDRYTRAATMLDKGR